MLKKDGKQKPAERKREQSKVLKKGREKKDGMKKGRQSLTLYMVKFRRSS